MQSQRRSIIIIIIYCNLLSFLICLKVVKHVTTAHPPPAKQKHQAHLVGDMTCWKLRGLSGQPHLSTGETTHTPTVIYIYIIYIHIYIYM